MDQVEEEAIFEFAEPFSNMVSHPVEPVEDVFDCYVFGIDIQMEERESRIETRAFAQFKDENYRRRVTGEPKLNELPRKSYKEFLASRNARKKKSSRSSTNSRSVRGQSFSQESSGNTRTEPDKIPIAVSQQNVDKHSGNIHPASFRDQSADLASNDDILRMDSRIADEPNQSLRNIGTSAAAATPLHSQAKAKSPSTNPHHGSLYDHPSPNTEAESLVVEVLTKLEKAPITLGDALGNTDRGTTAAVFYRGDVLASDGVIEMNQEEDSPLIEISKGPNYKVA